MDNATLEVIAEKVHEAWAAEKQRQGFASHVWMTVSDKPERCAGLPHFSAPCTVPKDKHHPDMLPYADLAENIKDYDRATVRAVLTALDASGYAVVPTND